MEVIEGWLTADKQQPAKQRHTARRIYNRLVEECAYAGGESTVRRYVRLAAGKHFVRFYPCERQQAFFDARFCNRGQGYEKGGVEGLVGFARRNYMVPVPEDQSLSEPNEKIFARCLAYGDHKIAGRDKTVNELYEQEKAFLICGPEVPFANVRTSDGRVDKYSTVNVDKNRYSVPTGYVGFKVKVMLGVDEIAIFFGTKKLATHYRLYGNNKWSLNADHYLDLIYQRPLAFNSAHPFLL